MDIPINVDVLCAGELCGRSTCLIINPINTRVTHLVVIEKDFPYIERLVSVETILDSSPNSIQLRCDKAKLSDMEPFKEADFISAGQLESGLPYGAPYLIWPYSIYEARPMLFEHEHIPAGEVVIRRGTRVKATDGQVGKVDEFLVDPKNDIITHLVLREGHLWGKKDVTIPVSEVDRIADDAVYLKLGKEVIATLPTVPVRRNWK
jgi:sporulation protein YlmC with PRC-barrel domain